MGFHESSIQQAADALRTGGPAVFPTDTVYGLGVSVLHSPSPDSLYRVKGRESKKPIAWLVDGPSSLSHYGNRVPGFALLLAEKYWPGPLTLIVSANNSVPVAFQSELGTIGMRMPDSRVALELIRQVGCPLATTSANISGVPAVGSSCQLDQDLLEQVGIAVFDESPKSGMSSTVVDCTGEQPVVLRVGSITKEEIADCVRRR